jgi:hypothetical protein
LGVNCDSDEDDGGWRRGGVIGWSETSVVEFLSTIKSERRRNMFERTRSEMKTTSHGKADEERR